MAPHRLLLLVVAMLLGAVAASGVQFSTAAYTATSAAPVTVTAANDWTPPTVAMTDPGSPLSGTVTLGATASDARSSVASVVIQRAPNGSGTWTTICTDNLAPYSCSWVTTAVADGTWQLRAVATDTAGYSAISTIVTTTVVNTATVTLGAIADVVRGSVPLSVTVTGNAGATVTTRFEYVVAGGTAWATIPGCGNATGATRSCTWVTSGAETYDVRAVAVIGSQTYYDTQTDVLVDNVVPTITQSVPTGTLTGVRRHHRGRRRRGLRHRHRHLRVQALHRRHLDHLRRRHRCAVLLPPGHQLVAERQLQLPVHRDRPGRQHHDHGRRSRGPWTTPPRR